MVTFSSTPFSKCGLCKDVELLIAQWSSKENSSTLNDSHIFDWAFFKVGQQMVKALGSWAVPCDVVAEEGNDCLKQCPALLGRGRGPGTAYQNGQGKRQRSPWWAGNKN